MWYLGSNEGTQDKSPRSVLLGLQLKLGHMPMGTQ